MMRGHTENMDLTKGPVTRGLLAFALPLLMGQLLQQLYNLADAWVVGNFAGNSSFAAVASGGNLTFLVVGFFNGIAMGGGVVISKYYGAKDHERVRTAVHNNLLFGLIASAVGTIAAVLMVPLILRWMRTPEEVLPYSLTYFRVYFGGVSTVVMYNVFMSIMRAVGDSVHPLYYLLFSSLLNIALDLLFVAVFGWDVFGAAAATVLAQGVSVVLCLIRMMRQPKDDPVHLELRQLRLDRGIMREILVQGIPTGIQGSVISIGNLVIQSNINTFGAFAMAGHGAYAKVEGFVFLPIMCMSMALPTFIGQNLGAGEYERAKKGALSGILIGMLTAEAIGGLLILFGPQVLGVFTGEPEAIGYGLISVHTSAPFFFLLALSHCSAGVMRGCGKSVVPMAAMLLFWCGLRIVYVTIAIGIFPVFQTIALAYPITWTCTTVMFLYYLLGTDWVHGLEGKA